MRSVFITGFLGCLFGITFIMMVALLVFAVPFVKDMWRELTEKANCPGCDVPAGSLHKGRCDVALCLNAETSIDQLRHLCKIKHNHGYDIWTGEPVGAISYEEYYNRVRQARLLETSGKGLDQ